MSITIYLHLNLQQFNSKIEDLTAKLDEKNNELKEMTEEKIRLEEECKKEKDKVSSWPSWVTRVTLFQGVLAIALLVVCIGA